MAFGVSSLARLLLLGLSIGAVYGIREEVYDEELTIRPLHDGRVATHFSFKTVVKDAFPRSPDTLSKEDSAQHYTLFPLALGQILREYAVTELHLTLNAGKWNYEDWGYPEEPAVGTGAEMWAWLSDDAHSSVEQRWRGIRNAFAGLFCTSLGSMDDRWTTSPLYSYKPDGSLPKFNQPHQLRHGSLPFENVCTENLTPFLKLLPCKASSGIASLLNPHKLFDADWHGMGVHVLWNETEGIVVRLTFQAVFDPVRTSTLHKRDWSFSSLLDRRIIRPCPVANEGIVRVVLPKDVPYALRPEPSSDQDGIASFDVTNHSPTGLDITMQWAENQFDYPLEPPNPELTDFSISRTLTGPTQSRGQLSVSISNYLPIEARAIYLETLPWIVQFYLHSMRATIDGEERNDLVSRVSYAPPVAHGRPMLFECFLKIPAHSTLQITLEVSKAFLLYTEHPPDAQRGWDLPPAVLVPITANYTHSSLLQGRNQARRPQRIYTPALLVDLATPDFSMPYNVIIMSCTLIALIFGSIFNLLTRKFVGVKVTVR